MVVAPTVKVKPFEVRPDEITVMDADTALVRRLAGITAVSAPELTNVVESGVPLK